MAPALFVALQELGEASQPLQLRSALFSLQITASYINSDAAQYMNSTSGICTTPPVNASITTKMNDSATGQVRASLQAAQDHRAPPGQAAEGPCSGALWLGPGPASCPGADAACLHA